MADDIRVAPSANGADPAVATDDIAGKHYQKIKLGWGVDGTWNETTDSDGVRVPIGGAQLGAINETAPASDVANSGLNGRLQRIAQRITSLIALLPPALGAGGGVKVDGSGTALPVSGTVGVSGTVPVSGTFWQATQPVSGNVTATGTVTANAGTNLNTSALVLEANEATRLGIVTETAPASDTASSGLNGRLQRVAQRLTALIALLPTALGAGGGLKVDGSGTALPVSGTLTANQGGTWTVQPGNTANTTAWKVDGSAVTQPVSGTVTANAGTNTSTAALAAATPVDVGDEAATDEAIASAAAGLRLIGFSARETTTTGTAVFNIRHGTSNAGAILVSVSLGPNESAREWYGPDGIAAASGIWLERVSGTIQVVGYSKVVA